MFLIAGLLFCSGFIAWTVSTIAGGGGAMLLVPLIGFLAGAELVAPVVTIATLMGSGGRLFTFGKAIEWQIVKWALPGAILGGTMGAALIALSDAKWISLILGLFLLTAPLQQYLGRTRAPYSIKAWYFLPAHLFVGLLSGLIGAVGPVMNSLYLKANITHSKMVATKTAISTPMQLSKVIVYGSLGALSGEIWLFALSAGLGALLANRYAKRILDGMSLPHFRIIVSMMMSISGAVMLWQAWLN